MHRPWMHAGRARLRPMGEQDQSPSSFLRVSSLWVASLVRAVGGGLVRRKRQPLVIASCLEPGVHSGQNVALMLSLPCASLTRRGGRG